MFKSSLLRDRIKICTIIDRMSKYSLDRFEQFLNRNGYNSSKKRNISIDWL
jgi:hypothetical protein